MVLFCQCYCGDVATDKALQSVDKGESIIDLFERAQAIHRFRIEEIRAGVVKALVHAFGK